MTAMPLRFEARPTLSVTAAWLSPLIAVVVTVVLTFILFASSGLDPLSALITFYVTPVSDLYSLGELLIKAAPLALIGAGLAIGFRAGVWNVGAEGQLTVGVIFGGGIGLVYGPGG